MSTKKIDFTLLEPASIEIKEDVKGLFFMIGDYRVDIPPHCKAKKFSGQEIISFFIDKMGDVGVGLTVCFLYDLLQKRKIKDLKIGNNIVSTEEEIRKELQRDE